MLDQLKEHGARRKAVLMAELEAAHAKIPDLQQRVFGRKSERGRCVSERAAHRPCFSAIDFNGTCKSTFLTTSE